MLEQIYCDCIDCREADEPCQFNCDVPMNPDECCKGCLDAWDEIQEIRFEIDKAQGKI